MANGFSARRRAPGAAGIIRLRALRLHASPLLAALVVLGFAYVRIRSLVSHSNFVVVFRYVLSSLAPLDALARTCLTLLPFGQRR